MTPVATLEQAATAPAATAPSPGLSADELLVVVPALNEARHIETCLRSLLEGDPTFTSGATIVVSDGGSEDATPEIVTRLGKEFPNLELVHNSARLQSAGINLAVRRCADARHRYLVRCDAHSVYPADFLRSCLVSVKRSGAASVVTVLDAEGETCFARGAAWAVDTPLGSGGSAHRGGARSGWVDHGHHAVFRLDWFRLLGGYDARFSHNEDAEYDHRLAEAGGRIWLEADLRIDYRMRPGPRGLARQYFNYGRGRAATLRKHRARPRLRQIAPAANLGLLLASLALAPLWPAALLWPAVYVSGLLAAGVAGALALKSPSGLMASPALAIMHNAWAVGFLTSLPHDAVAARVPQKT